MSGSNNHSNSFSSIVGHAQQIKQLTTLLDRNVVPHALLLTGSEGIGKRHVARSLASNMLLSSTSSTSDHNLFASGQHPDLHHLFLEEQKRDIPVESVRNLCSKLQLAPYSGNGVVAIIDDAHRLSISASNAMLMTLEEPVKNRYLILITHAPHQLPETIVSRCHEIPFARLSNAELKCVINNIATETGVAMPFAEKLLRQYDGSLATLGLAQFVSPISLRIEDTKELAKHIENFQSTMTLLLDHMEALFISNQHEAEARALSLASEIAANTPISGVTWRTIHSYIRHKLADSSPPSSSAWADALTASLEAQQQCQKHNANAHLQLSSLFLKIAKITC